MQPFVYSSLPQTVRFGHGTLAGLGAELARLGIARALLLTTPEQSALAAQAMAAADGRIAGHFHGAAMHTPVTVTEAALAMLKDVQADGLVAIGGGSTTGLAKALNLRSGLPQVVIPTTYAGSEMTPILGETADGRKVTQRDPRLLPGSVIYDVDLTYSLPPHLSAVSGMNAMAHAVEALYARDANPVIDLMAAESVAALAKALPAIIADPMDAEARWRGLYGAWLAGICLGNVGMALHHKLCHVLGGSFDLPHAETHCVVLPYALACNAPFAEKAVQRLSAALGHADPARALWDLAGRLNAPRSLAALGLAESALERAADIAAENPYWNPRPLNRDLLLAVLRQAHAGQAPVAPQPATP